MRGTRRDWLGAGLAVAAGWPSGAVARPTNATLLVPGPADGAAARWAAGLTETLAVGPVPRLAPRVVGGPDGVTAANRFATEAAPDGRTLLVLNGAAAQARLIGEARARFDPAGWLPVCASLREATLFGVGPLHGRVPPVRLGLLGEDAPAVVALLALDQLGIAVAPVFGLAGREAIAALGAGAIDAAVLPGLPVGAELQPWFRLGGDADPATTPDVLDLLAAAPAPLRAAIRAAGIAARLDAALMLPALTEADRLAAWRAAVQRWMQDAGTTRRLDGPATATLLAAAAPGPEAVLAYREWRLRRFGPRGG